MDMSLLMKFTRCEVMPSVSRKSALPLLKVALAEEKKAGVNLSDAHTVRARCVVPRRGGCTLLVTSPPRVRKHRHEERDKDHVHFDLRARVSVYNKQRP